MSNIDQDKLQQAKAKLACHIEPPKGSAYANMHAESGRIKLTEMTSAGG